MGEPKKVSKSEYSKESSRGERRLSDPEVRFVKRRERLKETALNVQKSVSRTVYSNTQREGGWRNTF